MTIVEFDDTVAGDELADAVYETVDGRQEYAVDLEQDTVESHPDGPQYSTVTVWGRDDELDGRVVPGRGPGARIEVFHDQEYDGVSVRGTGTGGDQQLYEEVAEMVEDAVSRFDGS